MRRVFCLTLILFIGSGAAAQSTPPTDVSVPRATQPQMSGTKQTAPPPRVADIPAPSALVEAIDFYRKGDFDHALAKFQDYLKDHPQSPDAYVGVVHVCLKEKKVDLAALAAEQGMAHTNSPRMRVARAEVWFRQGRIGEAEKEWVDVINSRFPEPRAYLGLARVREAIGNYMSAKKMIDHAHELDPDDPDIREEWIGGLSSAGQIKYLEDSLAESSDWSADQRKDAASYLDYLKQRAQQNERPCRLVSKVTATETSLVRLLQDPQHLRGYGLTVSINGHKSPLLLDTGSSGILIRRPAAERAGISKITETKVWGIGKKGGRDAYVGVADSIKIGELEFQNCNVEVMESRTVADEEGLIGTDIFRNFLVDLDFPNEKIKLSQLPLRPGEAAPRNVTLGTGEDDSGATATGASVSSELHDRYIAPEMQSYTRIFRFGHNLLVPTSIGKVPQKLFLLDTGALTNFISPAAAREVTKVRGDSDMSVEGVSGRVDQVYSANKTVLTFGHLRQENQDMTAFDTQPISDSIGTEVSGFLGFTLLRMLDIKIDYRDDLIDFQYDAKRFDR
jgi:tetratricopeptide (TPR) repeat protein